MGKLETQIAELREASRRFVRSFGLLRESLPRCGCTLSQCHALIELDTSGQLAVCGLADILRQDKSTASRTVRPLIDQGLVRVSLDPRDRRSKLLKLTATGRKTVGRLNANADAQVRSMLEFLDERERELVVEGMKLYAEAQERASRLEGIAIRPVAKRQNGALESLLRTLMREFGAVGPGGSEGDDELKSMSQAYRGKRAVYFVASRGEELLGGAGIAPLKGGDGSTCELRKMYLVPEARGIGLGSKLLDTCLEAARRKGFRRCYLETLRHMSQARHLYAKFEFEPLESPLGETGHFKCNYWAIRDIDGLPDTGGNPESIVQLPGTE